MSRIIYNKLIRDKIPEIIQKDGKKYEVVVLQDSEFDEALRNKLIEESQEVIKADDETLLAELADLQEIILALMSFHGIEQEEFETVRLQRLQTRGGFEKKLKLLWTD